MTSLEDQRAALRFVRDALIEAYPRDDRETFSPDYCRRVADVIQAATFSVRGEAAESRAQAARSLPRLERARTMLNVLVSHQENSLCPPPRDAGEPVSWHVAYAAEAVRTVLANVDSMVEAIEHPGASPGATIVARLYAFTLATRDAESANAFFRRTPTLRGRSSFMRLAHNVLSLLGIVTEPDFARAAEGELADLCKEVATLLPEPGIANVCIADDLLRGCGPVPVPDLPRSSEEAVRLADGTLEDARGRGWVTLQRAARWYDIALPTLYERMRDGVLEWRKFGARRYISVESLRRVFHRLPGHVPTAVIAQAAQAKTIQKTRSGSAA